MGSFGELIICIAALFSAAGGALVLASKRRVGLYHSGRYLLQAAAVASLVGLLVLVFALVTHDYRLAYVRDYADRTMSLGYLITAIWGGQEGSLLVWAAMQTWFTAAVALWNNDKKQGEMPVALAFLAALQLFFLALVLFHSNPFAELGTTAVRGNGLNPLLRNPYMAFHPPTLYLGFVGFSVPMAFALAALAEGTVSDNWLDGLRPWVLVAWLFLSVGNILGMIWAYEELGWGGYWGWDPVENASFLPWLTGTALVHTALVMSKRSGFRLWSVSLTVVTFCLIIFGTFLTRSGVIESVHAFAGSTTGPYFLNAIIATAVLSIGLVIIRRKQLIADESQGALLGRESLFSLTNWAFLAGTVFVWVATMMPVFSSVIRGEKVAVTPEFFNRWMAPIGLAIFALIALCSLIGWQVSSLRPVLRRAAAPLALAVIAAVIGVAHGGVRGDVSGVLAYLPIVSYFLLGLVGLVVVRETHRLMSRLNGDNDEVRRRRLGGQLVHLSMVLMFVGFTGSAFTVERANSLGIGQMMEVGDYRVKLIGLRQDKDFERQAIFADLEVKKDRQLVGVLSPSRHQYHSHPGQPTSEVAIRSTLAEDLFLVLGEIDGVQGRAVIRAVLNPLVIWIWIGGFLLAIGAVVGMLPVGWSSQLQVDNWRQGRTGGTAGALAFVVGSGIVAGILGDFAWAIAALAGSALVVCVILFAVAIGAGTNREGEQ